MLFSLSNPAERLTLLAALVLWAALLFGGQLLGRSEATEEGEERASGWVVWSRLGSSLILVLAAWLWYLFTRQTPVASYALFIAIGMTLGFIGDLALAEVAAISYPVIVGIAFFAAGHISYLLALIRFAAPYRLLTPLFFVTLIVWLLVGVAGWYTLGYRAKPATALRWVALPYALLLAGLAGVAMGLALQSLQFAPLALGAALFLASDLIIASRLFRGATFPRQDDLIWLTYGPAQALIVFSVEAALRFLGAVG